jgi:hypothetical protein
MVSSCVVIFKANRLLQTLLQLTIHAFRYVEVMVSYCVVILKLTGCCRHCCG